MKSFYILLHASNAHVLASTREPTGVAIASGVRYDTLQEAAAAAEVLAAKGKPVCIMEAIEYVFMEPGTVRHHQLWTEAE